MQVTENHGGSVETGKTGWISIHINDQESPNERLSGETVSQRESDALRREAYHLFEHAEETVTPLPERFPRLTYLAIALALLASALMAEFDYLRGAGYYWP